LLGTIVDDHGKGIAFRTACKEANMNILAPMIANGVGNRACGRSKLG
jgi:hypothetical protein